MTMINDVDDKANGSLVMPSVDDVTGCDVTLLTSHMVFDDVIIAVVVVSGTVVVVTVPDNVGSAADF